MQNTKCVRCHVLCVLTVVTLLLCNISYCLAAQKTDAKSYVVEKAEADDLEKKNRTLLADMPNIFKDELKKVMDELDAWSAGTLPNILTAHYSEVKTTLEKTTIPDSVGSFSVYWTQLKSVVDDTKMKELLTGFIEQAQTDIKPSVIRMSEKISEELDDRLSSLLKDAQKNISKNYTARFPFKFASPMKTLSTSTKELKNFKDVDTSRSPVLPGLGIVLALGSRFIFKSIGERLVQKVATKFMTRAIPFIGWALLAWEFYDVTVAKSNLEAELRKHFYEDYIASVTASSLWQEELRGNVRSNVSSLLESWENICRNEIEQAIRVDAMVRNNLYFMNYFAQESQKGISNADISQTLSELSNTYEAFVKDYPTENLKNIWLEAPDKPELSRLVRELREEFFSLHQKYGRDFMESVNVIGLDNFLANRMEAEKIGLLQLKDVCKYYSCVRSNKAAFKGLLLLLKNEVQTRETLFSEEVLTRLGSFPSVAVLFIEAQNKNAQATAKFFASDKAVDNLHIAMQKSPETAKKLLKQSSVYYWASWSHEDVRDLMNIFELTRTNTEIPESYIIDRIISQPEELNIYRQSGLDGLKIWWSFVKDNSAGNNAKNTAKKAIALAAQGFPANSLTTIELVDRASMLSNLPYIGIFLFRCTAPLGNSLYVIVMIFCVSIPVILLRWLYRRSPKKSRKLTGFKGRSDEIENNGQAFKVQLEVVTPNSNQVPYLDAKAKKLKEEYKDRDNLPAAKAETAQQGAIEQINSGNAELPSKPADEPADKTEAGKQGAIEQANSGNAELPSKPADDSAGEKENNNS